MAVKLYRSGGLILAEEAGKDTRFFTPEASDLWVSEEQVGIMDLISKKQDLFGTYEDIVKVIDGIDTPATSLVDAVQYIASLFPLTVREENGAIPVNIQDQTTQTIMLPLVREDAEGITTLNTIIDDYNVSLVSVVGFAIGQHFRIINSAADRFYFGSILDIQGLIVTVDTPFDFEYLSGSEVTGSETNMNVNGSGTPVIYTLRTGSPSIPSAVDITRIIITCIAETRVDLNLFGDLPILTKGLVLRKKNGEYFNIFNVKSNAEIANLTYDFQIYDSATPSQGIDGFVSRLTFAGQSKVGVVIRIEQGDNLEVLIQDNLTALIALSVIAEGHVVGD